MNEIITPFIRTKIILLHYNLNRKYKPILISISNYQKMTRLGSMGMPYNDILNIIMEKANVEELLKSK